jgi:hypothetical protein
MTIASTATKYMRGKKSLLLCFYCRNVQYCHYATRPCRRACKPCARTGPKFQEAPKILAHAFLSYIALPESIYLDLSSWLSRSPVLASPCLRLHDQASWRVASVSPALHLRDQASCKPDGQWRAGAWRPALRCSVGQGVNS